MSDDNAWQDGRSQTASSCLARGRSLSNEGRYDEAIDSFLAAINADPDLLEAHEALWETALLRKAAGEPALGLFETMKLRRPTGSEKQRLLNALKQLAYDPTDFECVSDAFQSATKLELTHVTPWLTKMLRKMNADSSKPEPSL
ncbi:MAG TPA: hypothetical protein VLI90_19035 [Tepidisphaeraceae bacterium]|nr:hypothetical protein [Tepidisphaeraceae bacterium]